MMNKYQIKLDTNDFDAVSFEFRVKFREDFSYIGKDENTKKFIFNIVTDWDHSRFQKWFTNRCVRHVTSEFNIEKIL